MYQKLNTPLNWLFLFLTPAFLFLWSQNGWGMPNIYWLGSYTHPDIIDEVAGGEVEAVFYSYQSPGRIKISPNGEWMWKISRNPLFRNLLTENEKKVELDISYNYESSAWLDNETILLKTSAGLDYHLLNFITEQVSEPISYYPNSDELGFYQTDDIQFLKNLFQDSQRVYAFIGNAFKPKGIFILLDENNQWFILRLDFKSKHIELYDDLPDHVIFVGDITHTNYSQNPNGLRFEAPTIAHFESHDGKFYAKTYKQGYKGAFGLGRERTLFGITIHRSDTDSQIGQIEKRVFPLHPIAWSADNQTLYFQVVGSARMEPWPIFSFQIDESLLEN